MVDLYFDNSTNYATIVKCYQLLLLRCKQTDMNLWLQGLDCIFHIILLIL